MMDLQTLKREIYKVLKKEKWAYLPKWVKEEEVEKIELKNVLAYVKKGRLDAFFRFELWGDVLELDWYWLRGEGIGRGSKDEYRLTMGLFMGMFEVAPKVESTFFEGVRTPVVKLGRITEHRYITGFRLKPVAVERRIIPEAKNIKWNGLYAVVGLEERFGYNRLAYELYFEYGLDFIVFDLPTKPIDRDYQGYYVVDVDREIVRRKYEKVKNYELEGELIPINLELPIRVV